MLPAAPIEGLLTCVANFSGLFHESRDIRHSLGCIFNVLRQLGHGGILDLRKITIGGLLDTPKNATTEW